MGSRGWRGSGEVQVRSPLTENWLFIFYSKFRGSPGTRKAKMQAAPSVSKMQDKKFLIWQFSKSQILPWSETFHPCYSDGVCLLLGDLMPQQHAPVSQGQICSDSCTCCHTDMESADPIFYLTHSQCTDTRPTMLAGRQNMTHYIDPCDTLMDQNPNSNCAFQSHY